MHTGTSNIQVSGKSKNNYIYTFSYGKIDCKDLHCQNLYITHRGTNDCFVYATGEMIVNIRYIGNVYYYGNPSYIESKIESTGQLIPLY